ELLVPAEVQVLEPARAVLDALAPDDGVSVRIEARVVAREEHFPLLLPQLREGRAVPVVHEAAVQRVPERLVARLPPEAAGIEIPVSADRRRVPAEEAVPVGLAEGGRGREQRRLLRVAELALDRVVDGAPFEMRELDLEPAVELVALQDRGEIRPERLGV